MGGQRRREGVYEWRGAVINDPRVGEFLVYGPQPNLAEGGLSFRERLVYVLSRTL